MRDTVDVLGIPVDNVRMEEAVQAVLRFLDADRAQSIYTPNAEIMMAAQRDKALKAVLCEADLLVADGAGVVLASKLLGTPLHEKVSGIDLIRRLFRLPDSNEIRFFFFGGKPGVAEEAKVNLEASCPGIRIVGCRDGYFSPVEETAILQEINASGANVLLVALGAPKQELWIHANKPCLTVKVCIGVGGSLDVLAGRASLAPEFFRKHGLEWLYRLYKEPWRYKRMLDLPRFMLCVLRKRMCGG